MRASFVDLRKKSHEILQALRRQERVTVLYRGEPTAVMHPIGRAGGGRAGGVKPLRTAEHEAFGMWAERSDLADPADHVRRLRRGRFDVD